MKGDKMKQGKTRKVISLMIALVMVITMIPANAFAMGKADADDGARAVNESVVKSTGKLDIKNLENGRYVVHGDMVKIDKKTKSMANNAINHNVILTVKDGRYDITLDFRGIKIGDKFGYLGELKYFLSGYKIDKFGRPIGKTQKATIETLQRDKNGKLIKDMYGTNYPDLVTFKMIPEALKDGYVPLKVFVPVMDSIAAGLGDQEVFLKLDLNTITKKPVEQLKVGNVSLSSYFYKVKDGTFRGTYNGNQMKATPVVKNVNGLILKAGSDYKVTYSNAKRVAVGGYTFKVEGMGNYKGVINCNLIITPKAVSTVNARLGAYEGGYNDAYVTWNKVAGADGYYVYMRRPNIKDNGWKSAGVVTGNSLQKKNLFNGYRYEFKVLPYVKAGINYKTTGNYKVVAVQTLMKTKINTVKKYNNERTRLTWGTVKGVTGYQVMVSAKGNTRYFTINGTAANAKVIRNAKTTFKVRGYKDVKNTSGKTVRVYAPWSDARTYTLR